MNLWAKSLRQLAYFAVALFFFSCEDDTIQGYKTNPRFEVSYRDFNLPSTVMQLDSLRTSNNMFPGENNRLLLGQYTDPVFGKVEAGFATQFFLTTLANIVPPEGQSFVLDSAVLELVYDFYTYGSSEFSLQKVKVFELQDNLRGENLIDYTNETVLQVGALEIASKEFRISPPLFRKFIDEAKDTTLSLRIKLNDPFASSLLSLAQSRPATTAEFLRQYKGLAVISEVGDKIMRFNPSAANSRIQLHYHTGSGTDLKKDSLNYTLNNAISFNRITQDYSGTNLNGVTTPWVDYLGDQNSRYIQSGAGLVTKIDVGEFITFANENPTMLINAAEIIIDGVEPAGFDVPAALGLRVFDEQENRLRKFHAGNTKDISDISAYGGFLIPDFIGGYSSNVIYEADSSFYIQNDLGRPSILIFDEEENRYSGFATQFFQALSYNDDRTRSRYMIMYPTSPSGAKSVNRLVFPADRLKLRIYYTTPIN